MDVARLNLTHGSYADHEEVYRSVRQAARRDRRGVAILVDLQGPKIRLGSFADGPVTAQRRATRSRSPPRTSPGTPTRCSTTYAGLPGDVTAGDRILIDDGKVALEVDRGRRTARASREVVEGGMVSDHKGINLPGVAVSVPALSDKDIEDLRWALRLRRRHGRAVVRALGRGHRRRARDHGRGGRPAPGHRQDREAAGGRERSRRSSRPSTASWSPAATSAWSCRSRRCRWCRSGRSSWPASTPSRSSWPPRCSSR